MDEKKADDKGELHEPWVGLDLPPAVLPAHLPPVKMNAPAQRGRPKRPHGPTAASKATAIILS